ncbi:MAG: hypothetical protein FD174_3685 [Geobacteraceae bacterium]|nr:MAG: hypothetical protein FD174_3685 [Geobacteraceae bacterium]
MQVVLLMLFAGCVGTPVTFKSLTDVKYDATKGRTVSGCACGFQVLFFIPIKINDRYERAYAELLHDAGPGYCVTDINVREGWKYGFVGTAYCTDLKATAYPLLAARGEI